MLAAVLTTLQMGYGVSQSLGDVHSQNINRQDVSDSTLIPLFSTHLFTSKEINSSPLRGTQSYLTLVPGIVDLNGSFYVRGSRANEIGYSLNGFSTTNRFFNNEGVYVIPEALEQISVHTGLFGVNQGWSASGLVETEMKRGGEQFQYSVKAETDQFVKQGNEFLGTVSSGYRNFVATAGGPLRRNMRFFVAGEHNFVHNRQSMFLDPFRFEGLVDDGLNGMWLKGRPLPGPIEFRKNYLDGNWKEMNTIQGNMVAELWGGLDIQLTGSYSNEQYPQQSSWPAVLTNYFRQKRNQINEVTTYYSSLRFDYHPLQTFRITLGASIFDRSYHLYDPDFGDDWEVYCDSAANALKGYTGWDFRYTGPRDRSVIMHFSLKDPNAPNNSYKKDEQTATRLSIGIVDRPYDWLQLDLGASLETWTMRNFLVYVQNYAYAVDPNLDGIPDPSSGTDDFQRLLLLTRSGMRSYGYNTRGNKVDDGIDGPRRPQFFAGFAKIDAKMNRFFLSLGIRYELYDLRMPGVEDIRAPFSQYSRTLIGGTNPLVVFDESNLREQSPHGLILPRLNLSARLGDRTYAFAAVGRFGQLPAMEGILADNLTIGNLVGYGSPSRGSFLVQPELSDQIECGLSMPLENDRIGFSIATYWKYLHNLAEVNLLDMSDWRSPMALLNTGEGIAKGLEMMLDARLDRHFTLHMRYAYTDAKGTTSKSTSNQRYLEELPYTYSGSTDPKTGGYLVSQVLPHGLSDFDFLQKHRGAISFECSIGRDDNPLLDRAEFNLLFTFHSGHPYRLSEGQKAVYASAFWMGVQSLQWPETYSSVLPRNSVTIPWNYNLDLRIAKTVSIYGYDTQFYVYVLNLLNTRNVVNVYPQTGTTASDGWFGSGNSEYYMAIPNYEAFYRAINLPNGWAFSNITGNSLFSSPRQIRAGIRAEL
jgi:hypothetical protein